MFIDSDYLIDEIRAMKQKSEYVGLKHDVLLDRIIELIKRASAPLDAKAINDQIRARIEREDAKTNISKQL